MTAADVVEAAERLVEPALVGREVRVTDRTGDAVLRIDPRLTSTALAHLLENAAQYSPAGSAVDIVTSVDNGEARFEVRDRGPGVAPEERARLFDRFYRGLESVQHPFGSGLGLGDHARPAGGAGWPRLGRQSSRRRGGVHDRRAMRPALILFVDDEKAIQRSMVPLLRSRGYSVTPAETGKDALAAFDAERPDLVVLDLGLPDMDGTVVFERIRARSDVPMLILSARLTEPDKIAALDRGADDYITKPFSPEELLARVRAALRRALGQEQTTRGQLTAGSIAIDLERRDVTVAGREVHLTPKEFDLLSLLAARAGQVVTHRAILRAIWGPHSLDQPEHLRVLVGQLRKKIEDDPARPTRLLTEPWVGYRLVD